VRAIRRSQEWRFIQKNLPNTYTRSQVNVVYSSLSENDQFESWLLSLSDEDYDKIQPRYKVNQDKTIKHENKIDDQWEREFWQKEKGE
jgi:hypothetical protein